MKAAGTLLFPILLIAVPLQAQVFTPGGRYVTGPGAQTMVAADFDGDSDIDLAISQKDADLVYIHLNDGDGDFSTSHTVEAARDGGLHAADFNNDGYNDLLLYDGVGLYDTWGTTVYLNNGDATFYLGFQDTIGSPSMAAADFDGDNNTDIAVYNALRDNPGLWIFFGTGGGNFANPVMIEPEATAGPVVGDVDNDDDQDILVSTISGTYCLLNNGDGTFGDLIPAASKMGKFAYLDGDEFPDLFRGETYGCSGHPAFMIGNGDGTFGPVTSAWVTAGLLHGIALEAADFNSDGYSDIALYAPEKTSVTVGWNDGRATFPTFEHIGEVVTGGIHLTSGDFDQDGDIDLAAVGDDDTLTISFSLGAQHDRKVVVPDDYATIQGAVDQAWNLDTILVCPGYYEENIDFGGKNLVLISSDCSTNRAAMSPTDWFRQASVTILDGGGAGRVLTFDDFEDNRSVVAGFTIQNGYAEGLGGGIYLYDTAAATIMHNIIKDNHAGSAGGGIFAHTGQTVIKNNVIASNTSGNWGGGIYAGSGTIVNNTIYGNTAEGGGGGLYYNYGNPMVCNNIFWANSSTTGGQQIAYLTDPPNITYCDVQGGWSGEGTFDADPLFVGPASGNFNLQETSPCIDAGDPNMPYDPDNTCSDIGAVYYDQSSMDVDDEVSDVPDAFETSQNYPNPFNPATTIEYSVAVRSHVSIEVFNVLGQKIRVLVDETKPVGDYRVTWDGDDSDGRPVATGLYFYRFKAGDHIETRKMILLK
jgi:hypothetical protein